MFQRRPRFTFSGNIDAAKALYMQAWNFAHMTKQSIAPGLNIQGPFRKIFEDGTEFIAQCVFGQDFISIHVPQVQRVEKERPEGWRYFQPILIINVYQSNEGIYISKHVDEKTWLWDDDQVKASDTFQKDITELSSLCTEHPYILNINSALYEDEEGNQANISDVVAALGSPMSYGFWCATIGDNPYLPFNENDLYKDRKEVTEIYNNTLPHPEYGTSWLMTGLTDLQEIFNIFDEKIKKDIDPDAHGVISLPAIVVINLQEYARAYNSESEAGDMGPVDDEVPLFVEWLKELPNISDIFVNHWFTASHDMSPDIPYARNAWCEPHHPDYDPDSSSNPDCDILLSEPAGGYESFDVHISERKEKGQTEADVAEIKDSSLTGFWSPWWGRWVNWISRTLMFHCQLDEKAFNITPKERYQEKESFYFVQGLEPAWGLRILYDEFFEEIIAVEWGGIAYLQRRCRYTYYDINFTAHPLLQEKNQYINRWGLLGKTEWTNSQWNLEGYFINGLEGVWSVHGDIYELPDESDPPYHGYEGDIDDEPSIRTDCPGSQECKNIWVTIGEAPWQEFLQIPVFNTFWDDSSHKFTQAVNQYD